MHRRRGLEFAVFHQAQLGSAAAHIDIQDAALFVKGSFGGTGTKDRQHGLHVVASGGANKLATLFGQHGGNGLAVLAAQGFAGEDDGTGIHFIRVQISAFVSAGDDVGQRACVHLAVAQIGREGNRGLVQRRALHHHVAAGQIFCNAAHVDFGEHHLRARRANVDAHAVQQNIVL